MNSPVENARAASGSRLKIAIISGEASGDRVGAQLATEIKRLCPDAEIWGTGGRFLREAGVDVFIDSSRWGVVGIASGLKILPRILGARGKLHQELLKRKPDVVIPIDSGAFNLGFGPIEGLCPWMRRRLPNTKILYYFPPGSWRRKLRTTTLAQDADAIATPFPWSGEELRRLGANATFVGHPLLDLVQPEIPVNKFAEERGIDRERPVVGILPGSRRQEIQQILPVQLEAAAIIHKRVPGVQFVLALAPTVDREDVVRALTALRQRHAHLHDAIHRIEERLRAEIAGRRLPLLVTTQGTLVPPKGMDELSQRTRQQLADSEAARPTDFGLIIVENATYDVMAASDVLMVASGTATLEAAILARPMVILYRLALSNALEYQFVKKSLPEFVGMPNILAQKRICPELLQDAATPEAVSSEVIALLLEPDRMLRMKEDMHVAVAQLGEKGGARRTAQMVIDLAAMNSGEQPSPVGGK